MLVKNPGSVIAMQEPHSAPSQLLVSASPHVRSKETVSHIMWQVSAALAPAAVFGVFHFGISALSTILVCIASSVSCEAVVQKMTKQKSTIADGSAVLSGFLLALCLPANIPWYMPALGSIVAIGVAKHMMGGLGYNVFNPAHIGRAFLMASYPVAMTGYTMNNALGHAKSLLGNTDAVTTATPLCILKLQGYSALIEQFGGKTQLYKVMLFGNHNGSIGETSALLLIAGGIYLALRRYIKWQTPCIMIATVGIGAWIFGGQNGLCHGDPIFHMMAGGLIIGAFFMATDPVTVPMTKTGQMIFAFGAGVLTLLIRLVGGYPEGVCYALLLMNTLTPLIDKYIYPKKFGT